MSSEGGDPIQGVLFDFHSTLVDQGDGTSWLRFAWSATARAGSPGQALGAEAVTDLVARLDRVWEAARGVDPTSRRDLNPALHREVFHQVMRGAPNCDDDLLDALYATVTDCWTPYNDTAPTLSALKEAGVPCVVLSNIGTDIRPVLARSHLADLIDGLVLSYEVGSVKPDPAIFRRALELLDVPASRALMVGDSWRDDAGAADLGCRVLILPRTRGPEHGLGQVLRLVL
jgi:HAD superfamily hydrolase (TIGR01493 family)